MTFHSIPADATASTVRGLLGRLAAYAGFPNLEAARRSPWWCRVYSDAIALLDLLEGRETVFPAGSFFEVEQLRWGPLTEEGTPYEQAAAAQKKRMAELRRRFKTGTQVQYMGIPGPGIGKWGTVIAIRVSGFVVVRFQGAVAPREVRHEHLHPVEDDLG